MGQKGPIIVQKGLKMMFFALNKVKNGPGPGPSRSATRRWSSLYFHRDQVYFPLHYHPLYRLYYPLHFELRSVFLQLFATNTLCAFRFEEVSRSTSVQNSCTLSQAGSSFSDRPLQQIVPFSEIHPLLFL